MRPWKGEKNSNNNHDTHVTFMKDCPNHPRTGSTWCLLPRYSAHFTILYRPSIFHWSKFRADRSLCLLSWLLHQICHFPFDQKVETDSTDTEHVHYWMQLAIFGRDPKSAVASFLEQQEFQFWQKNPNNQTGLIVLFSRTVLAVSVERTKRVLSGLKMEIIYMGFKSNDYHSLTQKWFHKMSQLHSRPFLVWAWMHCTRTQLQSHPSCLFLPFKQWEYSCRSGCQFPSEQAGISLHSNLTLAQ